MITWRSKHKICLRIVTLMLALFSCLLFSSPSLACTSPAGAVGEVIYNATDKVMQYCDGTNWIGMNLAGSGSGGCTNPTAEEGSIVFNATYRVNQVCAGNVYQAMGPYYDPTAAVAGGGGSQSFDTFEKIDSANTHSCGIKIDQSLWCWGSDSSGALGDGNPASDLPTPVEVSGGGTWIDVAVGQGNSSGGTCAIRSDGSLWCWGQSWSNCCSAQTTPVDRSSGQTWKKVSIGRWSYTCAIRSDDTLWCRDNPGSLTEVNGGGSWKSVSITDSSSACAIKSDDTLWCWGEGYLLGQPGTATADSANPVQVELGTTWKFVQGSSASAVDLARFCAVRSDDRGFCWGSNRTNYLGTTIGDSDGIEPREIEGGGSTWKEIASGIMFSCGIKTDNSLWCWGRNNAGQLGDGTTTSSTTPINVEPGSEWATVSAGGNTSDYSATVGFTCAIRIDGGRYCWGANDKSQLGNLTTQSSIKTPTAIENTDNWISIEGGTTHMCAIRIDNTLWCWGSDSAGQLGNGSGLGSVNTPTQVTVGGTWKKVALPVQQGNHTCAIRNDDTLWCWGSDERGQLGNGIVTTGDQQDPIQIGTDSWKYIAVGGNYNSAGYSCGIKSDDTLWCWGGSWDTAQDNLGLGGIGDQDEPVQVSPGTSWKSISLGTTAACGIRLDDTRWCWGHNNSGIISADSNTPVQFGTDTWQQIRLAARSACGIKTDGSRECWALMSGSDLLNWNTLSSFGNWQGHICGIQSNSSLWCWGSNGSGQLGDGTTESASSGSPVQVSGGGSWIDVAATDENTCAIAASGQIYCWGGDTTALGITLSAYSSVPLLGDCGGPPTQAGGIRYHSVSDAMIYCDGVGFHAIGK